jgi:uncharacterized protein DUF2188
VNEREVYHVVPRPDGTWAGEGEGAKRASVVGDTKAEVLERTIEIAKEHPLSQVIIHKQNGVIQEERTYGEDPFPPTG